MKRLLVLLRRATGRFVTVCPRCADGGRTSPDWITGGSVCLRCGWQGDA